jgi:hypothetical protein
MRSSRDLDWGNATVSARQADCRPVQALTVMVLPAQTGEPHASPREALASMGPADCGPAGLPGLRPAVYSGRERVGMEVWKAARCTGAQWNPERCAFGTG